MKNNKEHLQCIEAYLDENIEKSIELLRKLVSFDSRIEDQGARGRESGIQKFIAEKLSLLCADVLDVFEPDNSKINEFPGYNPNHQYENRPNVVAVFKGRGSNNKDGHSILFNGHADIVDPGNLAQWSRDPFKGEIYDGLIYGRGTTDMKGGLATAIIAIGAIKAMGLDFANDIILESVVDEEGGGNGTLACVERGYKADAALIMEATNLEVHSANRGFFLAEFTVYGKPIHSGLKGYGVNAIEKAIKLITVLGELEKHWLLTKRHPLLSNPTINIGQIFGGTGADTVADECTVRFDVEFFPCDYREDGTEYIVDKNDIKKEVEGCLATACSGDSWLAKRPVKVTWYQVTSAFQTNSDHPFVKAVMSACSEYMQRTKLSGFPAGCDGVYLAQIGKMPVVIFGPGNVKQAHTVDEFLDIEQYLLAIKVIANIILNWVGVIE